MPLASPISRPSISQVFDFGGDETAEFGPCTVNSTANFERYVIGLIMQRSKHPAGWNQIETVTHVANNATVLSAYGAQNYNSSNATRDGFLAVEAGGVPPGSLYLNSYPNDHMICQFNTSTCFYQDFAPPALFEPWQLPNMLGVSASCWTDMYCRVNECGAWNDPVPMAWWMADRSYDAEFAASVSGLIWPRAAAMAGAAWNFQPLSPAEFNRSFGAHTIRLSARGIDLCPMQCSCNEVMRCNTPYPKPSEVPDPDLEPTVTHH
jgi:hypothetical protein